MNTQPVPSIHECEVILVCFKTKRVIARRKVVTEKAV